MQLNITSFFFFFFLLSLLVNMAASGYAVYDNLIGCIEAACLRCDNAMLLVFLIL